MLDNHSRTRRTQTFKAVASRPTVRRADSLPTAFKIQVHKHSSKLEELTDSTFLLLQSINRFVKSSCLRSSPCSPQAWSPHTTRRCVATQSNPNFLYHKNIKYGFIFTYFLWHRAFLELQICGQFIANNQCWQGTTSMMKDYAAVHIATDEDRPSLPLKPISVSSSSDFYTFLHSPHETFSADSLCTICCVHMRFAEGSLSTAEQQGDWSSQSGNKERSPVSEKCKFPAIQRPETLRDWDGNNSCYTAPTGRDQRGQGG